MLTLLLSLLAQDPGPCVVLTNVGPDAPYAKVVEAALAAVDTKEPLRFVRPEGLLPRLRELRPATALVVVAPDTLDVNLARELLLVASRVDDDPFVDFDYGFITGRTPEAALAFLAATEEVRARPELVEKRVLEIAGPNALDDDRVIFWGRPIALPPLPGYAHESLNHGRRGFADAQVGKLSGYGVVHLGGHGVPERVEQGLTAAQIARVEWPHAIVWSGACWTGVVDRWFDMRGEKVKERRCREPFCLAVLERGVGAYLAALHPDHGIPVWQEIEHVMQTGCSLGAAMRHDYAQVVLASGGRRPDLPVWKDGEAPPPLGRGSMELVGTAARVLFGDPRIRPFEKMLPDTFALETAPAEGGLRIVATLQDLRAKASLMDTFAGDLGKDPMLFNDRALLQVPIPADLAVADVRVESAKQGETDLVHRLVGFAVEQVRGGSVLHVQVDFAATAFQRSAFRKKGSRLELLAKAK
jgi:hypothetical protein